MKRLSLLAASLALAAAAQAETVSFNFANALGPMEVHQTGSLSKFDSSLGTLTGVQLHVTGGISGTIKLTYGAATGPANMKGTTDSVIGFNSGVAAIDALFNGIDDLQLSYTTGFQAMNPNTEWLSGTLTDDVFADFSMGAVSALIGTGSFSLSCDSTSGFGTTGGGGFAGGSQTTFGKCGATITYTYDAAASTPPSVPEPGSLALIGLALAGLGFTARRKS